MRRTTSCGIHIRVSAAQPPPGADGRTPDACQLLLEGPASGGTHPWSYRRCLFPTSLRPQHRRPLAGRGSSRRRLTGSGVLAGGRCAVEAGKRRKRPPVVTSFRSNAGQMWHRATERQNVSEPDPGGLVALRAAIVPGHCLTSGWGSSRLVGAPQLQGVRRTSRGFS